jgi:hypothetical protein
VACVIGVWDASTALVDPDLTGGPALFILAVMATLGAACGLVACVRVRTSRGAPACVLVIAATYVVPVLSDRGGPWSAGVVGVALLVLAWTTQLDLRRHRALPAATLRWSGRDVATVAGLVVVLDLVVAVLGGQGAHGAQHVSTFAVLVGSTAACGLVAGVAALVEGARPTTRPARPGSAPALPDAALPGADERPAE